MHTADIKKVMAILPHRYPILLVDRVLHVEPGEYIETLKNVTINEPFFQGHFPGRPIMPGVLILEALAQAGGLLYAFTNGIDERDPETFFVFASADEVRFKQPVHPGDQLVKKVKMVRQKKNFMKIAAEAWVGEKVACSANILLASATL